MEAVSFMTLSEFKSKMGINTLSVIRNPKTGKVFAQANTGKNFRCKAALDISLPISVLIPESGVLDEACLVNGSNANVLTTI